MNNEPSAGALSRGFVIFAALVHQAEHRLPGLRSQMLKDLPEVLAEARAASEDGGRELASDFLDGCAQVRVVLGG